MGTRNHMLDTFFTQEPLEIAFPPPSEILPPLVCEDFLGLPKPVYTRKQRVYHDFLFLLKGQPPRNNVPTVVVQEHSQVNPLPVTGEDETRDVALPQVPRARPLKTPR